MTGPLTDEISTFVDEQRLAYVATVNADGTPNLSPKGTLIAWDSDRLVFLDVRSPRTVTNIRERPQVEVNVVDVAYRRGYRLAGTGAVTDGGPWFDEVTQRFKLERGFVPSRARHVVTITVERVRPLLSPAYDGGATEAAIFERWRAYWLERWQRD